MKSWYDAARGEPGRPAIIERIEVSWEKVFLASQGL
jgi:hypothetical protein